MSISGLEAESSPIGAVDICACLLKLRLEEESIGDRDSTVVEAHGVRAAPGNLVGPVVESLLIRSAVEEINVVLADEEERIVYRVRRRLHRVIVVDSKRRCRRI